MNLLRKINWLCTAILCLMLTTGCSDDDAVYTGSTQGYLKLHLVPQTVTRASLDDISDAKKVEVTLLYLDKDLTVTQPLSLSSVPEGADLGLETEKLALQPGKYQLLSYTLYAAIVPGREHAEELMSVYPDEEIIYTVNAGHITEGNLKVKATTRGKVYFDLLKDLSTNYQKYMEEANRNPATRAIDQDPELFRYEDVESVDLYVRKKGTTERPQLKTLSKIYTSRTDNFLHTDTISMEAGEYEITEFRLYSEDKITLLLAGSLKDTYMKVVPYACSEASFTVTFPENMTSIQDYIALYNIWISLGGPSEWSYSGESFPIGANWRFAGRPIDEWGNQPCVELDNSGRVKTLDLGAFNPIGDIHEDLGKLTEVVTLWLGTHNDISGVENDADMYCLNTYELHRKGVDLRANRMSIAKERLALLHPSPASEIYTKKSGTAFTYAQRGTYDVSQGSIANRITSIPETIGNLKKLNTLFIANTRITELPQALADLPELTDLELYNCSFKTFPPVVKKLQHVISLNFSCNATMDPTDLHDGLNEFITSSKDELQILYVTSCGLQKFPMALKEATNIGLIDMSANKLTELPSTDRQLTPVQAFFDDNKIKVLDDEFCETDDIEKFSISNNMLTVFPNLFKDGAESDYRASDVNFSDNHIDRFADGFKGINAETLTLTKNWFGRNTQWHKKGRKLFPDDLAKHKSQISYLLINNCEIDSIPPEAFQGLEALEALDLSGNSLRYLPTEFSLRSIPFLTGLNLNYNCFSIFPTKAMEFIMNKLYLSDQIDVINGKEVACLKQWPTALSSYPAYATLRLLDVSNNDIQKITEDAFPTLLASFNVSGNANIEMTVPASICNMIAAGTYELGFDSNQYILGCPVLDLDINK